MFTVIKRMEIAGSHCLKLPYESKCKNMHGHNWSIEVEISGPRLNSEGMLIDFTHIKEVVNQLDHTNINQVIKPLNPTAENIAKWIAEKINEKIRKDFLGIGKKKGIINAIADFLIIHPNTNTGNYIGKKEIFQHLAVLFPEKVKPSLKGMRATIRIQLSEKGQAKSNSIINHRGLEIEEYGSGETREYDVMYDKNIDSLPQVTKVSVQESEGNIAIWTKE